MTLKSKVESTYQVVATLDWKQDLAFTLLADSVVSDLENGFSGSSDDYEGKEHDHRHYEELLNEVMPSGGEITDALHAKLAELKIDVKPFLDVKSIEEMDKAMKKQTGVSLEELYNEDEHWAHGAVMGAVGHGVSETDDPNFEEWYFEKMNKDWNWSYHMESPYDGAYGLIAEMSKKLDEEAE